MKFENFSAKAFLDFKSNGLFSAFDQRVVALKGKFLEKFLSIGLPTFRNEEWKYTNLSFLNETDFEFLPESPQIIDFSLKNLNFFNETPKYLIHLHNGILMNEEGSEENFSLRKTFNRIDPFLSFEELNFKDNPLIPLNFALSFDGFLLELADNVEIESPFVIIFAFDTNSPKFFNSTNFVKVGKNSKVNLIVLFHNNSKKNVITNDFIHIFQAQNSKVEISLFQEESGSFQSFNSIHAKIEKYAIFRSNTISLGTKFARNNLNIDFTGEKAESFLNGIYFCGNNQFTDNHTLVRHLKPNCHSNQNYRGILDGNGRAVFNGKIFVEQGAQKTNAYQSNKNILLSDEARINTKPQLEIYADDVKCTHGATAGFLDTEALFYITSRGIDKSKAKALLLNSFLSENLEQIEVNEFRDFVKLKVAKELNLEDIYFCDTIESIENSVKYISGQ